MDDKKKTVALVILVIAAIGAAVFMGVRTMGGEQVEIVGTLEGVSKEGETGQAGGDPSGDMSNAPIINAHEGK